MAEVVAGAVVSNVVGKAMGGGSRAPTTQQEKIPGVEFQPSTYRSATGASVTGTPTGDYGFDWSATLPAWVTQAGQVGSGAASGLFSDYLRKLQGEDAYSAADEFYNRGLAVLEPEIAKQRTALGGDLFGSGRLGLKLAGEGLGAPTGTGAVNPDMFGFGAGVGKAYTNLYADSLTRGSELRTQELNELSSAADAMMKLGMQPMEIEQNLINFAKDLEVARSNALKAGTQNVSLRETPQSVFAGQLANTVGTGVTDYVGRGMDTGNWGLFSGGSAPSSYTGTWSNPDSFYSSGSSWSSGYSPMEASIYGL
jgi:hypothetical protein